MVTIVVTVMENTSCKVTECYLYQGPDNQETRKRAEDGFILQIEQIQGKLNLDQVDYYLEKEYYPGAYYTVCLVDCLEVHTEKEIQKQDLINVRQKKQEEKKNATKNRRSK